MAAVEDASCFDMNFNMRAYRADIDEFYRACKKNGEPDSATVVRRMMADYVDGDIAYRVTHEEA